MTKIRYSTEVQEQAIQRVHTSQTSAAQVAREVGCTPCTIHSWLKKYQEKNEQPNKSPAFAPIKIIDTPTRSVEIILPTGITIRLNDATHQSLASLIRRLEGVPC